MQQEDLTATIHRAIQECVMRIVSALAQSATSHVHHALVTAPKPKPHPARATMARPMPLIGRERDHAKQRFLSIVSERPGIDGVTLRNHLGVSKPVFYRLIRELKAEHRLESHGNRSAMRYYLGSL